MGSLMERGQGNRTHDGMHGLVPSHLVLRFAGDHERHLETVAALRSKLVC
jgi:hypothetical protein